MLRVQGRRLALHVGAHVGDIHTHKVAASAACLILQISERAQKRNSVSGVVHERPARSTNFCQLSAPKLLLFTMGPANLLEV